jgi:hypothetical protein
MYLIRDRQYNQCYTPLAFFLRRYPQCNVNNTQFFHKAFPCRSSCATWAASPFAQHGLLTTTKRQIKALTETALGPQLFQQCSGLLEVYRVKALREPAVDLRQQLSGCCPLPVPLPEPRQAQRGRLLSGAELGGWLLVKPGLPVEPRRGGLGHVPRHPGWRWHQCGRGRSPQGRRWDSSGDPKRLCAVTSPHPLCFQLRSSSCPQTLCIPRRESPRTSRGCRSMGILDAVARAAGPAPDLSRRIRAGLP